MGFEIEETGWADLHIHTNWSDGVFTADFMVQRAAELGLRAVAITDHDTVRGALEGLETGKSVGVEVIPGIEMSTSNGIHDVHILGYLFDPTHKALLDYIRFFQEERIRRAHKIIEKLRKMGIRLNADVVISRAGHGAVGRPHIADALMEEGFVLSYDEAFYKYIGDGRPAFVEKPKISPAEGMAILHKAGGLCFLAHPGMDLTEGEIMAVIKQGLDGLEIFHPKHNEDKVNYFYNLAVQNHLLVSGGSDCHGNRKGEMMMGRYNVPYQFVQDMKQAHARLFPEKKAGQ